MKKDINIPGLVKRGEVWWIRKMVNGIQIQKSTGCKDQTEAFRQMTSLIAPPAVMYGSGGCSFEVLIPKYMNFKKQKNSFSRFSEKEKGGIVRRFARIIGPSTDIRTLSEKRITEILTNEPFKNIKQITRNTYLRSGKGRSIPKPTRNLF